MHGDDNQVLRGGRGHTRCSYRVDIDFEVPAAPLLATDVLTDVVTSESSKANNITIRRPPVGTAYPTRSASDSYR